MNNTNVAFRELFGTNGDCQFGGGDICLVDSKPTKNRICRLYLGKCDIKENRWIGLDANSYLPFNDVQSAIRINDIDGFTKLSDCKTMPPFNEIYLVKRYIKYKQFRFHGIEYVYFIASRLEDFCPSFWYVNSWNIPCELYCDSRFLTIDGCAVVMIDKDDEFIRLN